MATPKIHEFQYMDETGMPLIKDALDPVSDDAKLFFLALILVAEYSGQHVPDGDSENTHEVIQAVLDLLHVLKWKM